jgi:uncharacterized RDD family membrane protein YckC
VFGGPAREFTLTAEDPPTQDEDLERSEPDPIWQPRPALDRPPAVRHEVEEPVRWGGFFRRLFALLVDLIVLIAFCALMFMMAYVGYKAGLAGWGRTLTWNNTGPLLVFTSWGTCGLATVYFVVFHGLAGKTIGKWIFGLRVVGPEQTPIGYRQSLLRWLAAVAFAPLVLGFLWVLWSPQKRAWHDYVARSWVIRDRTRG